MMNSGALEAELRELFNAVKIERGAQKVVDSATLLSLLVYKKVNQEYPEYFRYLSRQLKKMPNNLTESQFMRVFLNPQINLIGADKAELADVFSLLDAERSGSISLDSFLELYRKSQNYLKLSVEKQREVQDEIKEAFFSASEDGRINPQVFYQIVKFK